MEGRDQELKPESERMEPQKKNDEIFGSFFLNESEFALSVSNIQEVVNPPKKYVSLPLPPPYLVGILNLRGSIIPVVDLRKILKIGEAVQKVDQKIAILELDGHCIGLLFDRTGEIFRSKAEERSDFTDNQETSVIRGVFKRENGQRLVQILEASALFDLKNLPKQAAITRSGRQRLTENRRGQRQQCISFIVGPARCALGISEIQEILKVVKINESALAVGHCIGTIDLRGTTVPVIDFRSLLGYQERDLSQNLTHDDRRVIVMRLQNEFFGLLVDFVESIVSYYHENLKAFPVLCLERSEMFKGCVSIEGRDDILLLDSEKIFSNQEVKEITHDHNFIYNSDRKKSANESRSFREMPDSGRTKSKGLRRTFITFAVNGLYAIQITEVKEIIDQPTKLLQPPGLPSYFKGVLNLRGELVTIVDAREMYGLEKNLNSPIGKVLVFKKDNLHFGLVVDSIEAIVSFSEGDTVKIPELLYKDSNGLANDVKEAVQYKDSKNENKSILILDAITIANRLSSIQKISPVRESA